MRRKLVLALSTVAMFGSIDVPVTTADEGMWLFNRPPLKLLKERYGFQPSAGWMEHVQKSCVRFGRGGSASLVSEDGLVMTNHHVGRGQLEKLSTPEQNLLKTGFLAKTRSDELKCSDLEVGVLWTIEDVTARVTAAAASAMSAAESNTARQKRIAEITKDAQDRSGLDCEVVTLFHGARYHLYSYKRYTDVRLVMAPEGEIAHFGGDTDNFEYPRFCLDMTFFRIYENGKPLRPKNFLKWSKTGTKEGDLVFIAGHPGRTQRLFTVDHLRFLRDVTYPTLLNMGWRSEVKLSAFRDRGKENARIAAGALQGVQNGRKAWTGMLAGLHDPALFERKMKDERALRAAVNNNLKWHAQWGDAWERVSAAERAFAGFYRRYSAIEGRGTGSGSRLFGTARRLVRLATELPKPNGDRLRGYTDARLDSLYLSLYSPAPIYDKLEIERLTSWFSLLGEWFGGDDPLVAKVLAGKSPRDRAVELVKNTTLRDIAVRKQLAAGGAGAIAASSDPMIRLAYELDPGARALRSRYEDEVESVETDAYAKIAAAKFALHGEDIYPDATGSLRLTFGTVGRFQEDGAEVPAFTDFAGLYERHKLRDGVAPFTLPKRWLDRKSNLSLGTPYNFVSTCDVIGGNSGSPTFDRNGEVVGLVFDINLHALVWNAVFTDQQARTVHVDSRAIIEALRNVFDAKGLADELTGG